jgi:predicted PurR-regulated permease PerM
VQPSIKTNVITGLLLVLSIALIVLALTGIWYIRTILLYVLIAAILTMIVRPLERKLERIRIGKRKIPRSLRALILLLGIYAVVLAFIAIFIPVIADETRILSNIDTKQLSEAFHEPLAKMDTAFSSMQNPGAPHQTLEEYIQTTAGELLNVAQVSSLANSIVLIVGQVFIAFFVISFFTFFFIKDGPMIFEMMLLLVPQKQTRSVRNIFSDSQLMLSKYFTGVLIDVIFVATFVGSGMAILGVRNAVIIGLFAGVMNIIPYVGPLIGGAFALIIGASTNLNLEFYHGMLPLLVKIVLVFVAMNLTDGFLVQPYIFSKRVKAHPIEIFSVILVSGTLMGIGGMIAAVPLYTVIRIIAREFLSKYRFVRRLTDELEEVTGENDKP